MHVCNDRVVAYNMQQLGHCIYATFVKLLCATTGLLHTEFLMQQPGRCILYATTRLLHKIKFGPLHVCNNLVVVLC